MSCVGENTTNAARFTAYMRIVLVQMRIALVQHPPKLHGLGGKSVVR